MPLIYETSLKLRTQGAANQGAANPDSTTLVQYNSIYES